MVNRSPHVLTTLLLVAGARIAASEEGAVEAARRQIREGNRAAAIATLGARLAERPTDTDALTVRGIVLSWEGRYDDARADFQAVLARNRTHGDALPALIQMELWADRPAVAEELAREALLRDGQNPAYLYLRARALKNLGKHTESVRLLRRLLEVDPRHEQGQQMLSGMKDEVRDWEAGVTHGVTWFSDKRTAWRETQGSLFRRTRFGTAGATFSYADRFGLQSRQAEIEWYPRIRPGTYGYLNYGYSPDASLYPRYRFGAEIFQSVGRGVEVSGGMRRLGFAGKVNLYTGSVTKYRGDWMFTLRTFLTPDFVGTSRSFQLGARRYFGDGRDYIAFRVGRGAAPVEARSQQDVEILQSLSFAIEWRQRLTHRLGITLRTGAYHEDRLSRSGLRRYVADGGADYRF